ncbi:MAG TPA: GTP cyclohydrolase II [Methylophilus sp.]
MRSNNLALINPPSAAHAFVQPRARAVLPTEFGEYALHAFIDTRTQIEHMALVLGQVSGERGVLTRVHSECLTGDVFGSRRCDCGEQFKRAQQLIAQQGQGVILYLRGQEGRGIGLINKVRAYHLQDSGLDTVEANLALGLPVDDRQYDIASGMLHHLQVASIRLLSNNPDKSAALVAHGTQVDAMLALEVAWHAQNTRYLSTKQQRMGHQLSRTIGAPERQA